MTSIQPEVSSKFPETDFTIRSSDNVVCYFPRHFLAHTSTVFQDMMSTPQPGKKANNAVALTESSMLLELFLTHIDSRMTTPPIDPETIEPLLTMADKYHVTRILEWFKREAPRARMSSFDGTTHEAFTKTHPCIVLRIATQLPEFKELGRIALRELAGSDLGVVFNSEKPLNFIVLCELYRLHRARVKLFQSWVDSLKSAWGNTCRGCSLKKSTRLIAMMGSGQESPSWDNFETIYQSGSAEDSCSNCSRPGSFFIGRLKTEALLKEAELPDWPL